VLSNPLDPSIIALLHSVTLSSWVCSVYLQALATAIASTKVMKAQQVVKSESGEEVGSASF